MIRSSVSLSCLAMLALLSGCGSGGGSGGGGTTAVTPTTPTTPTPPTPPVTVTYETASDFSRDRSFTAVGTTATLVYAPDGAGTLYTYAASLEPESAAIGFDFVVASRTYRLRYRDDTLDQAATAITGGAVPFDEYTEAVGTSGALPRYFGRTPLKAGLNYTGFVLWRLGQVRPTETGAVIRLHRMLFGARTVQSDLPTSGSTAYNATVELSSNAGPEITVLGIGGNRPSSAQLSINWTSRALSGTISVSPPSGTGTSTQSPTVYTVSGTVSASGQLEGTVTGNNLTGPLGGNVYGPRAAEIGLLFTIGGTSPLSSQRVDYAGAALGGQ